MRALFYHPGGRWTGEARAFVAAGRGLASRGWRTGLAAPPNSPAAAGAVAAGLAVVPLDEGPGFGGDGVAALGAAAALARLVRAHDVDVVFAHGERAQALVAAALWRAGRGALVRRVPAGATLGPGSAVARAALRSAPVGFLCTWPEQAERVPPRARLGAVVADVGVPPPGERAAPGGAPAEERAEERAAAPAADGRVLVCAYEPTAHLRAATVLRAAALLAPRHPDLRVVLAGPGASDEQVRMHAAALGIHHRVQVHDPERGHGDATAPLAGAAAAWVVAEGDDGAYAALDAMAAGVPVLAQRGSTAAHYVADGITGVHLAPADVPGTAAVLAQLLAATEARRAMGAAGRARVARSFTEAAMVDGFARAAAAARERAPLPAAARAGRPA